MCFVQKLRRARHDPRGPERLLDRRAALDQLPVRVNRGVGHIEAKLVQQHVVAVVPDRPRPVDRLDEPSSRMTSSTAWTRGSG